MNDADSRATAKQNMGHGQMTAVTESVAKENLERTSNGNRRSSGLDKPGGAERGGPGKEAAEKRAPPDAKR